MDARFVTVHPAVFSLRAASQQRLAENPNDKLLPGVNKMITAIDRLAFQPSKRTGEYLFWQDTASESAAIIPGGGHQRISWTAGRFV